jgi:accessory gene regulator protein AgrB
MDIAVHWGVLRYLRHEVGARLSILITAIILDMIVLTGFVWIKLFSDPLVVGVAGAVMLVILIVEVLFLRHNPIETKEHKHE